jgi:hypothetical protein
MPDDTIYLKRGQNLNITATFADGDGVPITIDGTWNVSAAMKRKDTCDTITLSPTVSGGNVLITEETDDLSTGIYEIDIIADDNGQRSISEIFYLNLGKTITPLT